MNIKMILLEKEKAMTWSDKRCILSFQQQTLPNLLQSALKKQNDKKGSPQPNSSPHKLLHKNPHKFLPFPPLPSSLITGGSQ